MHEGSGVGRKELVPGMILELGPGDDALIIDPKSTATDATTFLKTQQGLIGAGQGLSYEAVSRDMSSAKYSSARQNAIEDEAAYMEEVELLESFMTEVYEAFVISGVICGLFSVPDFWERKEDYLAHVWVKPPKKWIDPQKESAADLTALRSGQKTFQDLQAEKGRDWKEVVDEMAEALAYGKEKGIDLGGVIFGTGATAAQQSGPGAGEKPGDPEHGNDPGAGGEQPGGGGDQPTADN